MHPKLSQRVRLPVVYKTVLDARRKTLVIFCVQRASIESGDRSLFIEFDIVFGDAMVTLHSQVVQTIGCGIDWIGFTKGDFESFLESTPVQGVIGEVFLVEGRDSAHTNIGQCFSATKLHMRFYSIVLKVVRMGLV